MANNLKELIKTEEFCERLIEHEHDVEHKLAQEQKRRVELEKLCSAY